MPYQYPWVEPQEEDEPSLAQLLPKREPSLAEQLPKQTQGVTADGQVRPEPVGDPGLGKLAAIMEGTSRAW